MNTPKRLPTLSICHLLGANNCVKEILVTRIQDYISAGMKFEDPHKHSYHQIVYFTKGSGTHNVDLEQFEVKAGGAYFVAPGQVHQWDLGSETDGFLVNFNETFFTSVCHDPNFLSHFPFFNIISGKSMMQMKKEQQQEVEPLLEKLHNECQKEDEYSNDMMRGILLELLVYFARQCKKSEHEVKNRHQFLLLRNFEKLVERHFAEKRLPKEYAEMLFVTPNHLNAVCTATVGKSAGEIIRERVLLEAKRLLAHSPMSISEVAYKLDFDDNAYFSRFFKKYTSITPESFRRSHKV